MFIQPRRGLGVLALAACLFLPALLAQAGENVPRNDVVRIGLISSLFRDVPRAAVTSIMQPFAALMESQTGMAGTLIPGGDADDLAEQLATDKLQLAVFHGIEFAWARLKHPDLRPLVIAINRDRRLQAFVLVRDDRDADRLADLKGTTLALGKGTKEHCRVFVERRCGACGKEGRDFFRKVTTPPNVESALDDVVDGLATATVVDRVALDCYQRRKPGRHARLRVLARSELFPAAVVAYRVGALEAATLDRFHDGMIAAGRTAMGRQLMTLWKLTGFEEVPEDYDRTCAEIVKAYPPLAKPAK